MSSPQRILIAHPSVELYGADRMLMRSAWALQHAGSEVLVTTPISGPLLTEMRKNGLVVQVCEVPVLRKGALTPRGLLGLAWLVVVSAPRQVRLLRRFRPHTIYVNTVTLPTWMILGRMLGINVVCHVREAENGAGRLMHTALTAPLHLAGTILCNSRATMEFVSTRSSALRRRCLVIYNGLPLGPDDSAAGVRPSNKDRPSLVIVGRLSPRKGQDVALRALGLVRDRGVEADLHLIGDAYEGYDWYVESLRSLAAELGLTDNLHFHGFVTGPPGRLYEGHDVALVPSRVEPFGNVAVEALGARTPVIASAVQGLIEVLEEGGGILVAPDDPEALADAIDGLLSLPPTDLRKLQDQGHLQVCERFSLARYDQDLRVALTPGADRRDS